MTEDPQVHYLNRNVPRKTHVLGFLLGPSQQCDMYFEPTDIDATPPSKYTRSERDGSISNHPPYAQNPRPQELK